MKRVSALLWLPLLVSVVSMACGSQIITPTPTPLSALDVGMTMVGDRINAEATQAKFESIVEITAQAANATATQQAVFIQATQMEQSRLDAQATDSQHRADAQSTAEQQRMNAAATQQRIDAEATQQALNMQATQMRLDFESTQEQARRDLEGTQSQARLDVQSTQAAAGTATSGAMTMTMVPLQVTLAALNVKQQSDTNVLEWLIPMIAGILLTYAAVIWAIRYSRVRVIMNEAGEVEAIFKDGDTVIRPKLLPGPVLNFEAGQASVPLLVDPSEQSKVTERAQAIEALAVMPTNPTPQAADTFNNYFGESKDDLPFDIIDAEDTPPAGLLNSETLSSLEKDWKEAKDE